MKRDEVLNTAETLINGDRARDYGDAAENFERIGKLWEPILGIPVDAAQVALCLTQLKVARLITSASHKDSWIDACGYLALGGEIAIQDEKPEPKPHAFKIGDEVWLKFDDARPRRVGTITHLNGPEIYVQWHPRDQEYIYKPEDLIMYQAASA